MGEKFEVEMTYERDTKRTYRFAENSEPIKIGTLYIQKTAFTARPEKVRVVVESV